MSYPWICLSKELHSILCCFILLSITSPAEVPSVGWEEYHLQGMPQQKVAQGHWGWGLPSHMVLEHSKELTARLGGNLRVKLRELALCPPDSQGISPNLQMLRCLGMDKSLAKSWQEALAQLN